MLTLERKSGECFSIGKDIVVKIVGEGNNHLQLEIDAPKGMKVIPGEYRREERERRAIQKISVWKENCILLLDPLNILYFTTDKKKVTVHTKDSMYESNSSLEDLEDKLCEMGFFRCHKSFLINMEHVDRIEPWFNSTYMIKLGEKTEQIPVSRHYTKRLRRLLSI